MPSFVKFIYNTCVACFSLSGVGYEITKDADINIFIRNTHIRWEKDVWRRKAAWAWFQKLLFLQVDILQISITLSRLVVMTRAPHAHPDFLSSGKVGPLCFALDLGPFNNLSPSSIIIPFLNGKGRFIIFYFNKQTTDFDVLN